MCSSIFDSSSIVNCTLYLLVLVFLSNLWLPALRMGVLKVEWCTIYLLLLRLLLLNGQGKPCRLTTTGQRASCNEYPLGAPEHCVSLWYLFMICSSAVSSFQAEHLPN